MVFKGKNIYVDVFGEVADYSKLPKADIIFLTHEHFDHLDPKALALIRTDKTAPGLYRGLCSNGQRWDRDAQRGSSRRWLGSRSRQCRPITWFTSARAEIRSIQREVAMATS